MPMATRYPSGRSQHFTFLRRNFLQGLALGVMPFFLRSQPAIPLGDCKPDFSIGDRIRAFWVDEFQEPRSENGQVVGVCWHPKNCRWEYLVVWGSTYFDEQLTDAKGLELNNHA